MTNAASTQIKTGDIMGYAADAKIGKTVRRIRIGCVYPNGMMSGRMLDGDFLMPNLRASDLVTLAE